MRGVYAPPDPFAAPAAGPDAPVDGDGLSVVTARVPLREMVGYLTRLRALTGGRGSFVMSVEGFERVRGGRRAVVERELGGG